MFPQDPFRSWPSWRRPGRGDRPGNIKAQLKALQLKEFQMRREDQTKNLIRKIDEAIEQAEDLGLALVASILSMARLEIIQNASDAGRGTNGQL
jgi:hypothetical protein